MVKPIPWAGPGYFHPKHPRQINSTQIETHWQSGRFNQADGCRHTMDARSHIGEQDIVWPLPRTHEGHRPQLKGWAMRMAHKLLKTKLSGIETGVLELPGKPMPSLPSGKQG